MLAPEQVAFALVTVATFVYLSVRVAALAFGPPPIPRRLLRLIEMRDPPPRPRRLVRSLDFWVGIGLITFIEFAVTSYAVTALAIGDMATLVADGMHWALELAFVAYLVFSYQAR